MKAHLDIHILPERRGRAGSLPQRNRLAQGRRRSLPIIERKPRTPAPGVGGRTVMQGGRSLCRYAILRRLKTRRLAGLPRT